MGKGIVRFLCTDLQAWAVDKWESEHVRELGCLGCACWFPLLRKMVYLTSLCLSEIPGGFLSQILLLSYQWTYTDVCFSGEFF